MLEVLNYANVAFFGFFALVSFAIGGFIADWISCDEIGKLKKNADILTRATSNLEIDLELALDRNAALTFQNSELRVKRKSIRAVAIKMLQTGEISVSDVRRATNLESWNHDAVTNQPPVIFGRRDKI